MPQRAVAVALDAAPRLVPAILSTPRTSVGRAELLSLLERLEDDIPTWERQECARVAQALAEWASLSPFSDAARILVAAGDLFRRNEVDQGRAEDCYERAVACDPSNVAALGRVSSRLLSNGSHKRLASLWRRHVRAVREHPDSDGRARGDAWHRLARLRAEQLAEPELAIEAYERSLDEHADPVCMVALAEAYVRRGAMGDYRAASRLYFALASARQGTARIVLLEQAADLDPTHEEARQLLRAAVREQVRSMPRASDSSSGVRTVEPAPVVTPQLATLPAPTARLARLAGHWPLLTGAGVVLAGGLIVLLQHLP